MKQTATLREHVERFCGGEPQCSFRDEDTALIVAKWVDAPAPGLDAWLTVGLSRYRLRQPCSGTLVRQELLCCCSAEWSHLRWEEVLLSIAGRVVASEKALMRGQLLGPAGPLFPEEPDLTVTALLCTPPAFFADDFAEYGPPDDVTLFVELIPVTNVECERVSSEGWSWFFSAADQGQIDILDLTRP